MNYHVLSNHEIIEILKNAGIVTFFLCLLFAYLASRDTINNAKKGLLGKIVPWIVLCVFIGDILLLISKLINYPWDILAEPSQASAHREMIYSPQGFIIFGWANDCQLSLLSSLAGSILSLCWTFYAFNYKPSQTSWWKKLCKVLAYILLSSIIIGFRVHQLEDFGYFAVTIIIICILLKVAKVKPPKSEKTNPLKQNAEVVPQITTEPQKTANDEDLLRFMPKDNSITDPKEVSIASDAKVNISLSEKNEDLKPIEAGPMLSDKFSTTNEAEQNELWINNSDIQEEELEMMYCKYCGKKIEADSTFCKYCGKKLQ